jgi:thiosulfate/3-mercaptopyruvate sulfurtransferase
VGPLVSAGWLRDHLEDVLVVDCSWRLGDPGGGERSYLDGHIPGAAFLDVDRDLSGPPGPGGRHPLPSASSFEAAARRTGIRAGSVVVAYDDAELGGAARLWWLLRHFGHEAAAVLDGGLAEWVRTGEKLECGALKGSDPLSGGDSDFVARPRGGDAVGAGELAGLRLLDARAPERFRGEVEPIDPVAGHIPGARNVPFASIAPGGRFLPPKELRERLGEEPFVAYCGSGVSACVLLLGAAAAGIEGARLYPGSWSEWSGRGLPAERG